MLCTYFEIVQKMVMVPLFLRLEDVPALVCFGAHVARKYGIRHKIILRTDPLITANT